jgi:hypothetical protein
MAAITATSMLGLGARAVTITTLGASDTFTYTAGKNPVLVFNNVTAGALTPKIDGAGGTTVAVDGIGSVDVSAGLTLASIGVGASAAIPLKSISSYLSGVITVTGGTGIEAQLLEF